jgi:HSP20 family protein
MTLAERLFSDVLGEDVNRLWMTRPASAQQGFLPSADLYETEDAYVVEMDAPGLHSENLAVEVIDGKLVVSGERSNHDEAQRYFRRERWQGKFVRSFQLGPGVTGDDISADYADGVLTIQVPKPEETKPKRIQIGGSKRKQLNA